MAVNVRSTDLDQLLLMPPSVRDWLPDGHLAFFILDVVAELELDAFYAAYRNDGRGGSVYDPSMMLAILLYAYCTGERSSRKVERRLVEDVAFRVIAANQQPDHATLARFRRRHQEAIGALFGQVLALCVKAGIVDAGVVSIDGTKIGADASFFANRKREDLAEQLAKEILKDAETVDAAEDAQFGDQQGQELPSEWAGTRGRRGRIRAALEELDKQKANDYETRMAQRKVKEAAQVAATGRRISGPPPKENPARKTTARRANTTDPHSRVIGYGSKGVMQGYNAQAAATVEQIVLAAEVVTSTNDQPSFVPMTAGVTCNLGFAGYQGGVGTFLADAGYWTAANATADIGAPSLIPTRKSVWREREKPDDDQLMVLARVNRGELSLRKAGAILGCSYTRVRDLTKRYFGMEGQRVTRNREPEPEEWIPVVEKVARGEMSKRGARDILTVSDGRLNTMLAHVRGEAMDPQIARRAMDAKFAVEANKDLYKKRAYSIEPVFGNIKNNLGYRRFARRGLAAVNSEWRLMCSVHNLLKLRVRLT